jgi:hypothetical protein
MKKTIRFFACLVFLLCAFTSSCIREDYSNMNVTITGTVVDHETEEALSGVALTLLPGGRNTYTGSDGVFQFNEIEPQQYSVQVRKYGYKDDRTIINPSPGETITLHFTMTKEP